MSLYIAIFSPPTLFPLSFSLTHSLFCCRLVLGARSVRAELFCSLLSLCFAPLKLPHTPRIRPRRVLTLSLPSVGCSVLAVNFTLLFVRLFFVLHCHFLDSLCVCVVCASERLCLCAFSI